MKNNRIQLQEWLSYNGHRSHIHVMDHLVTLGYSEDQIGAMSYQTRRIMARLG